MKKQYIISFVLLLFFVILGYTYLGKITTTSDELFSADINEIDELSICLDSSSAHRTKITDKIVIRKIFNNIKGIRMERLDVITAKDVGDYGTDIYFDRTTINPMNVYIEFCSNGEPVGYVSINHKGNIMMFDSRVSENEQFIQYGRKNINGRKLSNIRNLIAELDISMDITIPLINRITRHEFLELYYNQRLNKNDIAKKFRVDESKVNEFMQYYGISEKVSYEDVYNFNNGD